jgi:hypothetical protein
MTNDWQRATASATSGMDAATAEAAPWIERLARVGYAAKALLYATIGVLAAKAARGTAGGRAPDTRGALATVLAAPFGRAMLWRIALGLLGYAAWRIVEAVTDPERRGSDAKGLAMRGSFAARGLLHGALAFSALRLAMGSARSGDAGGGGQSEQMTARALDLPGGTALVWAIALGVGGYGLYQLYRAAVAKLSKQLDLGRMSAEAGRWVVTVSRLGIGARGIVFLAIALLLARAARQHDAEQAGGIGDALRSLGALGRWPYAAIALGLVAYGVYELLNARYRRIRAA